MTDSKDSSRKRNRIYICILYLQNYSNGVGVKIWIDKLEAFPQLFQSVFWLCYVFYLAHLFISLVHIFFPSVPCRGADPPSDFKFITIINYRFTHVKRELLKNVRVRILSAFWNIFWLLSREQGLRLVLTEYMLLSTGAQSILNRNFHISKYRACSNI